MSKEDNTPEGGEGAEEIKQLKEQIAELTGKLSNASGELATNRAKKQEVEADRDILKAKLAAAEEKAKGDNGGNAGDSTEAVVLKVLADRAKQDAATARTTAEARFKAAHKEFADDADQGGIKFSAVKQKFSRFNLEGITSVEDFTTLFEEAYTLAVPTRSQDDDGNALDADSPPNHANPKENEKDGLSAKETRLLTRMGWTKERYLKQKAARPTYVKAMLAQME